MKQYNLVAHAMGNSPRCDNEYGSETAKKNRYNPATRLNLMEILMAT